MTENQKEEQDKKILLEQTATTAYLGSVILALIEQTANESKDKKAFLDSILDSIKHNNDVFIKTQKEAITAQFNTLYDEFPEYKDSEEIQKSIKDSIEESIEQIFPVIESVFETNITALNKSFEFFNQQ